MLEVGMIATLMLSGAAGETMMRDTIYSVIIIVMSGLVGLALFLGGFRHKSQNFNFRGIKHYLMSITPLALIVLALPTAMGGEGLGTAQLVIIALACLFVYYMFLRIQTVTHRQFFLHEHEDGDDSGHGMPSRHSTPRHFLFLCIHLAAVISITKMNSYPLGQFLKLLNAPPALTGFLAALLILSPESVAALNATLCNQAQRGMNLMLGAVLTTISLTVPVVVSIAILSGQNIILGLSAPNILLLVATLLLCQTSLTGGKTNAHSGSAHLIIFAMYVMLIFS
jgi:Ca2+:H+ antiporter